MQQYLSYVLVKQKQEQQLICQQHNRQIEYINTDQKYRTNPNLFQCPQCFRETKDQQKFISISEILYTHQDTNLNLLNAMANTEDTEYLKEKITNSKVILHALHKKMIGGLDEMQKQLNEQINKAKSEFNIMYDQTFSSIQFIDNSLQSINNLYNQNSFRSQVKNIITNQHQNQSSIIQKSAYLKQLFYQLENDFGRILQNAKTRLPELLSQMEMVNQQYENGFLQTKCNLIAEIGMNKLIEAVQFPNQFKKSKSGESVKIKQRKNIFTNKLQVYQEIISELSFSKGVHQVMIQVLAQPQEGNIFIGLTNNLSKHQICYFELNNQDLQKDVFVQMIVNFDLNQVLIKYYQPFQKRLIKQDCFNDAIEEDYNNLKFSIIWDSQDTEVPIAIIYCD